MRLLFVGSTGNQAGQTIFAWAIARRLKEKGLNVGFFKPFGTYSTQKDGIWTDHDAILFKEALGLSESLGQICPYLLSEGGSNKWVAHEITEEINLSLQVLSKGKDIVIVMGSKDIYFDDISRPVPDSSLISKLNADCLLIHRFQDSSTAIYSILSVFSLLRDRLKGIVLNRVPAERIIPLKKDLVPFFIQKGISHIAVLQDDPFLSSRRLEDIVRILNGEIIFGEEGLSNPVGGMTVGNTDLIGDLVLLRRVYNKIVLIEPAKKSPDPNLPRKVAGIILTGGKRPAHPVLDAVKKEGIPLVLVRHESISAIDRIERTSLQLSPRDEDKVKRFMELLDEDNTLEEMLKSLGLS